MRQGSIRNSAGRYRPGIALAITLVVLVVLSVTTTILAVRVAQVRQRQRYIMDYQKARYGLDSATKYILAVMPEKTISLADRQDAPDFSDLFWLTREQYLNYISAWAETAEPEQIEKYSKPSEETEDVSEDAASLFAKLIAKMMGKDEQSDPNNPNTEESAEDITYVDPEQIVVPGPYGPPWPNVIEPIELDIGDSQITITIEDENAKMPLSWAVTNNININKQARAAMLNFSELMMMDEQAVENLFTELNELGKRKMFQLNPTAVMLTAQSAQPQQAQTQAQSRQFTTSRTTQRRTATRTAVQPQPQTQQQARPAVGHAADFAKLFHSSLLDLEPLSVPLPDKAFDDESPMKYLALWGSQRININTAPRQVLEAAFTFGGSPEEIADKIIRLRREKPFKTIADLRDQMFGELNAIDRAAPYIDVKSNFFSIRITSRCGSARTSAVAAVIKEGKQVERLIILYGR